MPLNLDIRKNAAVAPIIEELEGKLEEKDFQLEEKDSQIEETIKRLLNLGSFSIPEVADFTGTTRQYVMKIKEETRFKVD